MKEKKPQVDSIRPPVVVVMGHIDHGKSTLLDYIRKSNVVDGEAGGITQHLSAYTAKHTDEEGKERSITFLDTPGHEAFQAMRSRGAASADIAILVVSAEDSVKTQTLEAYKTIKEAGLPYVVAINKIDRPNANAEKTKLDLAENGIYLEGYGGDIAFAEISAKTGEGIPSLLEVLLLTADLHEFKGNPGRHAEGIVIESHLDSRRGITATLIVRDGTLSKGMFVVSGGALCGTRIMEDFTGSQIDEAGLSQPVGLVGWNELPEAGTPFLAFDTKKEAEAAIKQGDLVFEEEQKEIIPKYKDIKRIPIIIRGDTAGTTDAVVSEIKKLEQETIGWKILLAEPGLIGEGDVRMAGVDKEALIVGFNTKTDARAQELNEQLNVPIKTFDIIYKLSEYLAEVIEERRPRIEKTVTVGTFKVQKTFSRTKNRQVIGGEVKSGEIEVGNKVRIMRRENEIAQGEIVGIEHNKAKTSRVTENTVCGMLVEAQTEIAPGDYLEATKTEVS